jgi:hypothetical protein
VPAWSWRNPPTFDLFLEEPDMPDDPTALPVPPGPPAHPWKKTARTVLGAIVTAAVLLPVAVNEAGIDLTDDAWKWLATVIVVLGAVTRLLALPAVNVVLETLGIGHDDVESAAVLALKVPATGQVVAGEAAAQTTGQVLPASTTVAQLRI